MKKMKKKKPADYLDPKNIVHPETNEVNLDKTIRYIVEKLHQDPEVEKLEIDHLFKGSLTAKLKAMKLKHVPALLALLQKIGVARIIKHRKPTIWLIADETRLEYFLRSEDVINAGIFEVNRERRRSLEYHKLKHAKEQKEETSGKAAEKTSSQDKIDEVAGLFVTIEKLKKEIAEKDETLKIKDADLENVRKEVVELRKKTDVAARLDQAIQEQRKKMFGS